MGGGRPPLSSALDPLEGLPVFQIWRECRQIVGDTNLAKKIWRQNFLFQVRRDYKRLYQKIILCAKWPLFLDPVTFYKGNTEGGKMTISKKTLVASSWDMAFFRPIELNKYNQNKKTGLKTVCAP